MKKQIGEISVDAGIVWIGDGVFPVMAEIKNDKIKSITVKFF